METHLTESENTAVIVPPIVEERAELTIRPTAQEMRVSEVTEALLPAYQKASTLELTDAECKALMDPFPDQTVDIRPHDGLLFISHIHISNRLNLIFKPGKWALIRRRDWFDAQTKVVYGEYILLIRGCYIGESIGGHQYIANNPKTNYSDALESTAAEALRRICGKRLSCGSQVWDSEYCRNWVATHAEQVQGKWRKAPAGQKPEARGQTPPSHGTLFAKTPQKSIVEQPKATASDVLPREASSVTRDWALGQLRAQFADDVLLPYFVEHSFILPEQEKLEDWSLGLVPTTRPACTELIAKIGEWQRKKLPEGGGKSGAGDEWFWDIIVPVPHKGQSRTEYLRAPDTLRSLYDARHEDEEARARLFGFLSYYEPKGWTNREGKEMPPNIADLKFREALDAFGQFVKEKHPEEHD